MKILKISLLAWFILMFTISCSSKILDFLPNGLEGIPDWVLIPEIEGAISSVGSASKESGNDFSFQRKEAIADARDNMVEQLSTKVGNIMESFKASAGNVDDFTFDKVSERVSKQVASQILFGSKPKSVWVSKNGTMYILLILDTDSVIEEMQKSIRASSRNERAIYQKFLASKAQGELGKELEKFEE